MSLSQLLMQGVTEYKDGGEIIQHPPTALAIRAAKHIAGLEAQHGNHVQHIQAMQNAAMETDTLMRLHDIDLTNTKQQLQKANDEIQSLRESARKAESLGAGGSGDTRTGNPDGSGLKGSAAENNSTSDGGVNV